MQLPKFSRRISIFWFLKPPALAVMTDQERSGVGVALAGENLPMPDVEGLHRRFGPRQLTLMAICGGLRAGFFFRKCVNLLPPLPPPLSFLLFSGGHSPQSL